MAFALFRTESDQRINVPIRTNTQRFCLVRTVRYQAKGFSSPRNPTRAYPSHRGGWQPPGDFGAIAMPLDQALETISTNPYFLQLRQDFE